MRLFVEPGGPLRADASDVRREVAGLSLPDFGEFCRRYLGYANEVGESFKAFISKTLYRSTYAAAITYGTDTLMLCWLPSS